MVNVLFSSHNDGYITATGESGRIDGRYCSTVSMYTNAACCAVHLSACVTAVQIWWVYLIITSTDVSWLTLLWHYFSGACHIKYTQLWLTGHTSIPTHYTNYPILQSISHCKRYGEFQYRWTSFDKCCIINSELSFCSMQVIYTRCNCKHKFVYWSDIPFTYVYIQTY